MLLHCFETAPRDRKRCWIQQEKIKEGEVVHPALPWAVAVVCAEDHKQWTGSRNHPSLFSSHKCFSYWTGKSHF